MIGSQKFEQGRCHILLAQPDMRDLARDFFQEIVPILREINQAEHLRSRLPAGTNWLRVKEVAGQQAEATHCLSGYAAKLLESVGVKIGQEGLKWAPAEVKNTYPIQGSELFARQFEAWVNDSLDERSRTNRFLVNGTHQPVMYPAGAERTRLNALTTDMVRRMSALEPDLTQYLNQNTQEAKPHSFGYAVNEF